MPTPPSDVTVIGALTWDRNYYRIVQEKTRYFLWGFTGSPGIMTPTGKQIFINAIDYMVKSYTSKSVVFVYAEDNEWGLDFASLLSTHGITTKLIPMNEVQSVDFSFYNLIIFDSRTNTDFLWPDTSAPAPIKNSGKPVLAIGMGGATLFERMGLSINYGNAWTGEDTNNTWPANTKIFCVNPSMPIFKSPLAIDIPSDSIITVYDHSNYIAEYQPALDPDVVCIGREPVNVSHFTITSEGIHYLWGFTHSPWSMTQTGKDLFYNIVVAMSNQLITGMDGPTTQNKTLPREFSLSQNFPNPFNPSTSIEYSLRNSGPVTLTIFNIMGQEVATLVNGFVSAGTHTITWQAEGFPTGIYFCRMQAGAFLVSEKLVLLK